MRKRERERISARRRDLRNAKRRLSRAEKAAESSPSNEAAFRKAYRERVAVEKAHGRLKIAILAPPRARLRDVHRRSDRYRDPIEAAARAQDKLKAAQRAVDRTTGYTPESSRQARAEDLIAKAIARGEPIDEAYRRIARQTGLTPSRVYTMFLYGFGLQDAG